MEYFIRSCEGGVGLLPDIKKDGIFVRNVNKTRTCVLLLPVTRTDSKSREKWKNTLKLLELNNEVIVVIIDKTSDLELSNYCNSNYHDIGNRLYVLCRPRSESVFDSQKYVTLDSNLWITQIHDDDEWSGLPTVPSDAQELDVFVFNTNKISLSDLSEQIVSGNLRTQEIIFGAVPSRIWNAFVDYIDAQGSPVADSLDSTLYLLCDVFGKIKTRDGFSYSWVPSNWTDRSTALSSLQNSTRKMGWGKYSGVNASLVHRALDQMSAFSFCTTKFGLSLSKTDIEYVISRFKLLTPTGSGHFNRFSRMRIALSATRDVSNRMFRLLKIIEFMAFANDKIRNFDTLTLYLTGAKPVMNPNVFFGNFLSLLGQLPDPNFKRKYYLWKSEIDKISLVLQE